MISRNLRHLRVFLAVADLHSVTGASELYNVSQPAVTQTLSKLEAQAGGALFNRTRRGFFLNERGTMMASRVRRALEILDPALEAVSPRLPKVATVAQLQALIAVASSGNFTLAARQLGLSQPAVHRAVSQLEQAAETLMFQRAFQGLVETRSCQTLVRFSKLALTELDQADVDLGEFDGYETGRITIGTLPLSRTILLPYALDQFRRQRPNLLVTIVDDNYENLLATLRSGEIDLVLGALRDPLPFADVEQETLFQDRSAIVARPGHPLAGRGTVDVSELIGYPWVVPHSGTQLRRQFETMFTSRGLPIPASIIEAGFILLIRDFLDLNDSLAITSGRQVSTELKKGHLIRLKTTANLPLRDIGMTKRAGWMPTRPQQLMLDHLRRASRDLPSL